MAGPAVPAGDTQPADAAQAPLEPLLEAAATTLLPPSPVTAAALAEVEDDDEDARKAAENLERRMADLELRNQLALCSFEGPGWDRFAEELARYGHAVMMAWLNTGEIFRQCRKKQCYPGPPPERWSCDDWMELV